MCEFHPHRLRQVWVCFSCCGNTDVSGFVSLSRTQLCRKAAPPLDLRLPSFLCVFVCGTNRCRVEPWCLHIQLCPRPLTFLEFLTSNSGNLLHVPHIGAHICPGSSRSELQRPLVAAVAAAAASQQHPGRSLTSRPVVDVSSITCICATGEGQSPSKPAVGCIHVNKDRNQELVCIF